MNRLSKTNRDGFPPIPDRSTLPPDGGPEFNRLVFSTSPYLLQHARNPVDWYPWGDEAFKKAAAENKPVFLSIGYSTCHWCHVMAHESFEDPEVAAFLREHFVAIKVDREERPDIDAVYMDFCQATTGGGGWPLSVFLTPDRKPFYAGTYFPRESRYGMPGILDILGHIDRLWHQERSRLETNTDAVVKALRPRGERASDTLNPALMETAIALFSDSFDSTWGGFGRAPKFPMAHNLIFMIRRAQSTKDSTLLEMVEHTLLSMARGGLYDQLGYGFCRYSVDARWHVPHFEKMLYDNALLLMAYVEAWQLTGNPIFANTARETATYLRRELVTVEGGLASAENADSEGVEGRFYVFTRDEIITALGSETGALIADFYGVTASGNFEHGQNVLFVAADPDQFAATHGLSSESFRQKLLESRRRLWEVREARIHPSLDDKILTGWNGLAIAALSRAGVALNEPDLIETASRAADFILEKMNLPGDRLLRSFREGKAGVAAFLEDYAFLTWGLIELYQATFNARYLERALAYNQRTLKDFLDKKTGLLYLTAHDGEQLFMRPVAAYDGAIPAGQSVAALNCLRLARLTGSSRLENTANQLMNAVSDRVAENPTAFGLMLTALDFASGDGQEIVLAGRDMAAVASMAEVLRGRYLPRASLVFLPTGKDGQEIRSMAPFLNSLPENIDQAVAYVCRKQACRLPAKTPTELSEQLPAVWQTTPGDK
ncbi:MAG: thioredoxin domain-containing protein [Candidatus Riflebacteria bacterium]|nr:thioredoxin domain-containing protein [Candidatus Riflebacteria bacterium]